MIEADRRAMVETLAAYLRREGARGAVSAIARERGEPRTTISTRLTAARKDPAIVAEAEALAFGIRESRIEVEPVPAPSGPTVTIEATQHEAALFSSLRERLRAEDIAPERAGSVSRVKLYQSHQRGADGEPEVVNLSSFELRPGEREGGPEWPVVQRGPAVEIKPAEIRQRARVGWRSAVILPDMQVGHWEDAEGGLVPVHDTRAIDIARQVVRSVSPDVIVMVGDNLDLPAQSRHRKVPAFARTTQAAIDEMTLICAGLRADAPDAEIVWIAGNHDERLPRYIMENAAAAFGIRQGAMPESWPVLSVPHLCRLDDSGVKFLHGYPAAEYWINDRIRVIHGHHVRSKGSTAHVYLSEDRHSTLFGHVHRIETAMRTRHTRGGPRTTLAACFGCLCRVDGAVPSAHSGMDENGRPVGRTEDWQQGVGVVSFQPGDGDFFVETVPIFDGWTRFRGQELVARETEAA